MSRNMGKIIIKSLSSKYSSVILSMGQKLLDDAKKSATDALKILSKRAIQKNRRSNW